MVFIAVNVKLSSFATGEHCYCRCLDIAPRAQLLKKSARLLHVNNDKEPPIVRLYEHQMHYPGIRILVVKIIHLDEGFRGITTMRG